MTKITFLGTGGGRYTMIFQKRSTGGIYIRNLNERYVIDPGPGTLTMMKYIGINPMKIDAIFVSHGHPDHYTNVEVLIEAMTRGGRIKRGMVVGSKSVIAGIDNIGPVISKYHLNKVAKYEIIRDGKTINISDHVRVRGAYAKHSDPTTTGFIFYFNNQKYTLGYMADTEYDDKLLESYKDCDLLIIPNTRPVGKEIPSHLSTDRTAKLVMELRPRCAILTHMGVRMLEANPEKEARWIEAQTGVKTIAAEDGMNIFINGEKIKYRPFEGRDVLK